MPDSLGATPLVAGSLSATENTLVARVGFFPGDFPGASAYPGVIWGYGVLGAVEISSRVGTFPPFYPPSYPGRGSTLAASPIS